MSSSIGEGGPTFSFHASSTCTWQVAQEQAPPHSATMPGAPFLIAFSITVEPTGASTGCFFPPCWMWVIWGIDGLKMGERGRGGGRFLYRERRRPATPALHRRRVTPVDRDYGAADKAARLRRQKKRPPRHVLGPTRALQR